MSQEYQERVDDWFAAIQRACKKVLKIDEEDIKDMIADKERETKKPWSRTEVQFHLIHPLAELIRKPPKLTNQINERPSHSATAAVVQQFDQQYERANIPNSTSGLSTIATPNREPPRNVGTKSSSGEDVFLGQPSGAAPRPQPTITQPFQGNNEYHAMPPTVARVFEGNDAFPALPSSNRPALMMTERDDDEAGFQVVGSAGRFAATRPTAVPQQRESSPSSVENMNSQQVAPQLQTQKIFVKNISPNTNPKIFHKYFSTFGPLVTSRVYPCRSYDTSCNGIVEFVNVEGARAALQYPNHKLDGSALTTFPYREKPTFVYQIFLGGIPKQLSSKEVHADVSLHVKVKDLNVLDGFAYLAVERDEDVKTLLDKGYIKIGHQHVECQLNKKSSLKDKQR
ncbi:hypothetical protein BV898_08784 [Hypsibius exemplaris]|uniref:RRM domain-containing protein n=1 Tax=Hypsibius exemplaris TaxID=2072580 RepID=A0A1W0WPJ2_HYPEX|nr:hypothetical protein BV898_08784 [Hypsibius exemplaris]